MSAHPVNADPVSGEPTEPRYLPPVDGARIALHHLGGDGPPLLFVHATGFNARTYTPFTTPLTERYSVWAPDLRAHGWSTPPTNGDYRWDRIALDVLAAVDHLGIPHGELDAVGHSIGAAVVLLADSLQPGLLRRMYGYEPIMSRPGEANGPGENPLMAGASKRREVFASRAEAMERYAARPPFSLVRADALLSYVTAGFEDLADGTVRLRCRGADEAATYGGEWVSTNDRIVACRAQVTVGKGADEGSPNQGLPAYEALSAAELKVYDGLGHFGPMQAPELIAADALATLSEPA